MRVVLAEPRGFCAGVVRAIDIVERAIDRFGAPVYVRHEIVHNQHVVGRLKVAGAIFVDELSEVPDGAVTIFSAHGVARSVAEEAAARGLPVLDATCPLVAKAHAQVRRYAARGRALILVGHAGHPEVLGTLGQVEQPMWLVSAVADVDALDLPDDAPAAYVTQTTLSVDDTARIIAALHRRFSDLIGPDTSGICYATQHRQAAVRELCKVCDVLLVVGAANSSNSNRLCEIGRDCGLPSHLVADAAALDPAWFEDASVVGLTAGASAPESLVQGVIAALRRMTQIEVSALPAFEEGVVFSLPPALRGDVSAPRRPATTDHAEAAAAEQK